jgi:Tol biopolymer transport system component
MAHRSYLSPDGQWVLLVEMDGAGAFVPCRVVPLDGSSTGRQVGPPSAPCTSAAWSPDGRWIYLSVFTDVNFHVWRERFPVGRPEQVTFGPTEQEGIAMAVDGRSFVTSMGLRQRTVSIHDARGDRQISAEGYAYQPSFSPDGRKLYYRVLKGGGQTPYLEKSELWVVDLDSGRSELLLPGFSVTGYDISEDGRRVVFAAVDDNAKTHLWLAATDHRFPPRAVPNAEGLLFPHVGRPGEVLFVAADGNHNFAFRIREDGQEKQKLTPRPVNAIHGISPDRRWFIGYSPASGGEDVGMEALAYQIDGGAPVRLYGNNWRVRWSPDMKDFYLMVYASGMDSGSSGTTYVLPVRPGHGLPDIPPGGFRSEAEIAAFPGVRVINHADVSPGLADGTYAFSAGAIQRNLYRIPIP